MYSLNYAIKSFAVANEFVMTLNKISHTLGTQLTPFSLGSDEFQKKHNVVDLSTFAGLKDSTQTILGDIVAERCESLKHSGVYISTPDEDQRKTLFYQYLMTVSICYVEVEGFKTVNGVTQPSYDKFLCTRNPKIMAEWMGTDVSLMQAKYSERIRANTGELSNNIIRYVKLNQSAKGNSITVPRSFKETPKMRCVPLFMLYAWMEGCKDVMRENIVKFTFLKDNHTERELCSTLSEDIVRRYYTDNDFIATMFSSVDMGEVEQGGMYLPSNITRGYVKVLELGASIYDSTGTRSLNMARILKAEVVDDIDTRYINVSLDSVVNNFKDCLDHCLNVMPEELINIHNTFIPDKDVDKNTSPVTLVDYLMRWAYDNEVLFSTQFKRELHNMLVSNPQWFPLYTGVKSTLVSSTQDFGVAPMNF